MLLQGTIIIIIFLIYYFCNYYHFYVIIFYFSILIPDLYDGYNKNNNNNEIDPIQLAAALESRSAHPLANAIVSCNKKINKTIN